MHQEYVKYAKLYSADDVLIKEGERDNDFFCLLQGTIGVWKGDLNDKEKRVKVGEISETGTYFGEMSCLLDEPRSATIVAMTDTKVLRFPGDMLSQMLLKQPKLALKLCTAMADRLKGTTGGHFDTKVQAEEIRDDATAQFLYGKEAYQRTFVMLTAVQSQLQNPLLKSIIETMSHDRMLKGGRKLRLDDEFLKEIPSDVKDLVQKTYADLIA